MKKAVSFICVLCCLLFLIGCDPSVKRIDKDELFANTVNIELYDYDNEDPQLLRINGRKKPRFDFTKATLIAPLNESLFEDLLSDIAEDKYLLFGTALNEPMGKTLVLHQSNGNMIVLFGCAYTNEKNKTHYYGDCYVFDQKGTFIEHIGDVTHLFSDWVESAYFQNNS